MLRSFAAAVIGLGFLATLLALPPDAAGARAYRSHVSAKKKTYWARNKARQRAAMRARKAVPAVAQQAATPGQPLPPKRPLKLLTRADILGSDPARLERLGRRIIVGFQSFDEVRPLVEKGGIAGIFITDHNVRGRKADDVAKDIQSLQDIRKAQGLPRLIVAADQEGGYVSRLSPPLKQQPSLGTLVAKLKNDEDREKAVRAYAEVQAQGLERLGVTMNFGPVVDLRLGTSRRNDGETQLFWRAIDSNPYLVAKVAGWYCDTLTKFDIICTLKHFPGLGRVARDTHVVTGEISATTAQLELSDWLPFRRLMGKPGIATMIGHVRVTAADKDTPASYSGEVINSFIRARTEGDVLLITDDLGMGAVTRSKDGLGGAAVKAVNAGVDLLLLSDAAQYYDTVMSALIEADSNNEIDQARQIQARERLSKYVFVDDSPPRAAPPQHAQQEPAHAPPAN
ncbi:Glycoside hydrolase family 3 domain protein [Hyphomicrobium sp. GJ21]|uniref:glycoside hydrolase family 3 N-terminal domain-containing protein n=1 Tax=Hyphomicrobium sp. GJ21 TaxID=113574 RepID=UPI000622C065|nr:glycoside hydrolase family 3 N-terminal domain-containing protein [Hyphomicrobium sp. GJ21]CEJ88976.1 Glycoside hydrolase family 3 domain protein [Hyphomicrobium sp. GJ21]